MGHGLPARRGTRPGNEELAAFHCISLQFLAPQCCKQSNGSGRHPLQRADALGTLKIMAHPLRIKICGVTRESDLKQALDLGADAIGFNFHPASPRQASNRSIHRGSCADFVPIVDWRHGVCYLFKATHAVAPETARWPLDRRWLRSC